MNAQKQEMKDGAGQSIDLILRILDILIIEFIDADKVGIKEKIRMV